MDPKTLREKYFKFFQSKEHTLIQSASLIPQNDASVLFTTAGMQPLAPYFLGEKHPKGVRVVDVQKCLRTVDIDEVGDNTHHTFFQMLGNWSFGDYFKKESIEWSFEFLTKELGINLSMLAFTVYKGGNGLSKDDESADVWRSLGVSNDRLAYLGKDNFWSAGETGPCGPSSEIFYWTGDEKAPTKYDSEDERWVEIWNNVFMSYNRLKDGSLEELKQKNVDTGMGFERTLAVLNGKKSAYETELFSGVISKIEELSGKKYSGQKEIRIIADHIRSAVFVLGDENSVTPSNVDRGYILRRLIRRAVRYGKVIGIDAMFLVQLAEIVIKEYSDYYSELNINQNLIVSELKKEEEKFALTLEKGLKEFEKMSSKDISGKDAFLLFQSYGFPYEMTEELAAENGIKVDQEAFDKEFEQHQSTSRTAAAGKFKGGLSDDSEEVVRMHTATHLLLEALRRVVSDDIRQRGSNITPERLRFDFSFDRKLTDEEKKAVECEVNRVIGLKLDVVRKEMPINEAEKLGAQKEFGAKYPDMVSVYFVGDYSKEFCGGPHVSNTSEIGKFKIKKEQSSSAGVRRIKAVIE